ncbi:hypothetical protein [Hymenobacter sp. UYCo722]|uniref:hypothetical protein n=1 Tax=Hymenobacter sp. UYCo722 TaxID=3156335 RepID=UPI00339232FF
MSTPLRFAVGSIVHFGQGGRYYEVLWRGQLVVGPTGHRVEVYLLGGDTWDCYYGNELWSIGQHPF